MDLFPVSPNPRWRLAAILGGWPPCWKISNGRISGTDHPTDFVFDPRVGFSGTADRMDLFPVGPNPRLENFKWPYLWNGVSDRLRV